MPKPDGLHVSWFEESFSEPVVANRFVAMDFETTGLWPSSVIRTIEVGLVSVEGRQKSSEFESLINPQVEVPETITRLTGITSKEVETAPPPTTVFPKVVNIIEDAVLVAHNAIFEKKFLEYELLTALEEERTFDFICTMLIARRLYRSLPDHKLGNLAEALKISWNGNPHRALADARVTAKLLLLMISHLQRLYPDQSIDSKFLARYQKLPKEQVKCLPRIDGFKNGKRDTHP